MYNISMCYIFISFILLQIVALRLKCGRANSFVPSFIISMMQCKV
jgi:hypothetical protein